MECTQQSDVRAAVWQNDARQRLQYMQRVSGNVPYQQLLVMLQDSNSSVSSLQGVVQAKERQIGDVFVSFFLRTLTQIKREPRSTVFVRPEKELADTRCADADGCGRAAVIQQQLTELSNVREMTVDAEKQLMRLKEALDWKTITLQQMTAVLSSCQVPCVRNRARDCVSGSGLRHICCRYSNKACGQALNHE
eukprot:617823-Rhodomonas_salina.2